MKIKHIVWSWVGKNNYKEHFWIWPVDLILVFIKVKFPDFGHYTVYMWKDVHVLRMSTVTYLEVKEDDVSDMLLDGSEQNYAHAHVQASYIHTCLCMGDGGREQQSKWDKKINSWWSS